MDEELVDFVLVYQNESKGKDRRDIYSENLRNAGLEISEVCLGERTYVKLKVSYKALLHYAELLAIRVPLKKSLQKPFMEKNSSTLSRLKGLIAPEKSNFVFTAPYSREKHHLFVEEVSDAIEFTVTDRIMVVWEILQREKFGDEDEYLGINRLLKEETYLAAYPLHDGNLTEDCDRKQLAEKWTNLKHFYSPQPLNEIKNYFGPKVALYFTWLQFYSYMLLPASVFGILMMIYGMFQISKDRVSQDICNSNITMCPRCPKCQFWSLNESCIFSKVQAVFDNNGTICFSVGMTIWSILYLELWKRYSARTVHNWGLSNFTQTSEPKRADYVISISKRKLKHAEAELQGLNSSNEIIPFWAVKLPKLILSYTFVILLIGLTAALVFGIIIYKLAIISTSKLHKEFIFFIPITSALLNFLGIAIMDVVYKRVCTKLTELEVHRTQSEYENSLTLKLYLFECVNYYSSIFYVAFLKGKFVGYPAKYNKILKFRQEECDPSGCFMELTIQLAIIMIGKQFLNLALQEFSLEGLKYFKSKLCCKQKEQKFIEAKIQADEIEKRMMDDFDLSSFESNFMFMEYLKMVIQYGFVILFVTAFPLAPLLAYIYNLFQIRLDAKKFILCRRAIPSRAQNIGVWCRIMESLTRIAIVTNAFIIAFSSNFIPELVYKLKVNSAHNLEGFLEHSLAYFNVSDFDPLSSPDYEHNVSVCRYREYRNSYSDDRKYKRPLIYWHILAARLAFVLAYQNILFIVVSILSWIPDTPKDLKKDILNETNEVNQEMINYYKRNKDKTV